MKRNTRQQKQFELEALEPRVLLSADALLVSAVAADAVVHHPAEVVHHDAVAGQQHFQDSVTYNSATETTSVFEGVSAQPVQTQTATAEAKPVTHSGSQDQHTPVQNSANAAQSAAEAETAAVSVAATTVSASSAAKVSTSNQTTSATTTSNSSSTMTQQMTASLTAANGPPANSVISQTTANKSVTSNSSGTDSPNGNPIPAGSSTSVDLFTQLFSDITNTNNQSSNQTLTYGPYTGTLLGGIISFSGVNFQFTLNNSNQVSSVSVTAASATLNLSGASASIGSVAISYNVSNYTFSITLGQVSIALPSFVHIGANSVTLTYTGGSNGQAVTQTVNTINPSNTTTPTSTDTVTMMTLGMNGAYVFAGVNGSANASSTAPTTFHPNAEGLSITGVNLALVVMSSTTSSGAVYYGLSESGGTVGLVGLPSAFKLNVSNLSVGVNGSNAAANGYAVNFDSSFTSGSGGKGMAVPTGGTPSSITLDFNQPLVEASGTVDLNLSGFVYVMGNMSFQAGTTTTVHLTDGTTSTDNGGTASVSVLEVAASGVTVFAGINGPTPSNPGVIPTNAVGVEINNASFTLALMITSNGAKYYGLQAGAGSVANLITGTPSYNTSGNYTLTGLTVGDTYQWTQGNPTSGNTSSNDTSLVVDSTTTLTTSGTFVATQSSVTLTGTASASVTAAVTPYDGVVAKGLPQGVTITSGTVSVGINAGVTSGGGSATPYVVDFDTSFTTTPPAGSSYSGLTIQTSTTSGYLDFTGPLISVAGSLTLDFDGFLYVSGNMSFQIGGNTGGTLNLTTGTTTVQSMLEVGASSVTIFAGVNGPSTNSGAEGIELDNAGFALALISGADGHTYYGLKASADSLAAVGLPAGFNLSGSNLFVAINGSDNSGTVANFDTSFSTGTGGKGLLISTGGGNSVTLDFTTQLLQVQGGISLQFSSYISLSGGFAYTQTSGTVTNIVLGSGAYNGAADLTFKLGTASSTLFTATGSLNMTITAGTATTDGTTTINSASLTVSELKVANVLDVTSPSVSISNISIDNRTGDIVATGNSTLTITAASATLFEGSTILNGSVTQTNPGNSSDNGLSGTFDLVSGAFAVNLEVFTLNVSTVLTATADNVNITYSPGAGASQQIVSISSLTATFNGIGNGAITGNITNLVIYGNGFKFDSATLSFAGDLTLGSVLKLTNPSVTLTNFSVTFDGTNTTLSASSVSVGADSASVTVGSFDATASGLTITVSLTDGSTTIVASSLDFKFGSFLSVTGTNISINTSPGTGNAYLTVGTASATVKAGSFTVTGTVTGSPVSFSVIDNNGTPEFQAGNNFTVTLTAPTPEQLHLPSWLGFSITKFEISWPGNNFSAAPGNFQITLSASISSIQGLPHGVTVSGEITDAVIDLGKLENGQFPITSIGSVGGSVRGTLFGMEVNAGFVLGLVSFNAENQIVSDGKVYQLTTDSHGNVTETQVTTNPDTTIKNSIMYVGADGGAEIPGVGGVQIYVGFSSLGPLTFYMSAEFPLILDPDTGLAIGGFSGGVIFDYTIPTPQQPTDLASTVITPSNITISQWQQQLRDQTVVQYTSSNGGANLAAAYSQPFVIAAGVTIYDAYLSQDAFTITGNIAIQINPANPDSTSILVSGTATFGGSVSFNAYLYLNITVSGGSSTATVMFLAQAPANLPVETYGGTLKFGFTDSHGNPITPPTVASTIESEWIAASASYNSSGTASLGSLPAGTYTWTPGANDTSLTVGANTYQASSATNGTITITIASAESASLTGTANTVISGTLSSPGNVAGAQYTITTYTPPPPVAGFYISLDGFAQFSAFGTLSATVSGSVTLTVTNKLAKIDLSGDLSVSGLGDLATASGELVVDYSGGLSHLEIYGALQLQTGSGFAKLENVGLYVDGAATFILNTTDSPQTVYLPDPNHPHVAADATQFNITDTQSFEVTIAGVGSTPSNPTYASLSYKTGGDTVLNMQGSFDLKISASGLTMFADINSMSVGPSATPFLTFSGFGLFVINAQGFAAEMDLSLKADNIQGITLNAQFTLVMNTTQTNVVYDIPSTLPPVTIPGTNNTTRSLTIPAGPPQGALQSNGTYGTNVGPTGPYIVITGQGNLSIYDFSFTGFFYFQLSDSSAGLVVAMYVNVMGDLGFGSVNVTGGFTLSSAGIVVLLQASGSAGTTSNYGAGVSLQINAELAINTTSSPVSSIGGVALTDTNGNPLTLAAKSAHVIASGTLTLTFGPGSLVINGIFTTTVVTTGSGVTEVDTTTITANGTLTATVGGTTLLTADATGVLVFAAPGPGNPDTIGTNGLGLAGELTLTLKGPNPLNGTGFSFNGSFDLEVNTTQEAQSVTVPGLSSPVTISAGPNGSSYGGAYAEIHANGTMLFGVNTGTVANPSYNGFVLNGDFYLTVSATGLAVSANVDLGIYVAGTSLASVNGTAAMTISSSGFAASLVVTAGVDDPNGLYGFNGTLSLQVNTTGVQQTIGTVVIPAGPGLNGSSSPTGNPYFQVYISGTLALGTTDATISATSTGMYVNGNFALTISPSGLTVAASGTLKAYVLGSPLLTMNANGALIINSAGIAGELSLTVTSGDPLDSAGLYSFSGSFNLQLNTTGNNYYIGTDGTVYTTAPAQGTSYITITSGPDGDTTATSGYYFEVEASGTLIFGTATDGFSLSGNMYLSVGAGGLDVTASAAFTANVLGTTLLNMDASGALIITSSGLAGNLTLTFATGSTNPLDGTGFGFSGAFYLVVNTTGNNYYIQSDGSISTTVPVSGATAANTISAGPNGDTTTPGSVYFEVDANGTLLFGTDSNGFELTGDLFLSIGSAGLAVSTNDTFTVNVGGNPVIDLNARGAMEITSAGLAASFTLTASSGNDLFSDSTLPFGFTGVFTFQLNTTNQPINDTVGGTQLDLPAGPYFQIYINGSLGLGNTSATTGLFLNGTFYLTISSNGLAIAATANLTATFAGTTLLTLGADGGLVLTSNGLAGAINLTIGNGNSNPLSGTGFSFNGTFTLQVNTTGSTYYFWSNGTVSTNAPNPTANPGVSVISTVSAGPNGSNTGSNYFQIYASGAITFGSSSNGFALSGSFYLEIGDNGLAISVSANFTATVLGSQLINVHASGAMEITAAGMAASINLTVPSLGIGGVFTLSGTFAFQINTTNQAVTDTVGGVALNLPKGPYFQLSVTHASLTFGGNGTGFGLTNGSFILSITSGGMAVSATATLGVTVGGTSLASFSASGALLITSNGIAAKLNLTLTSGFSQSGSSGFSFNAAFVLELNTTSLAINTINNVTVNLPRGPYFEILASGSLVMGGLVNITGSFTFTLSNNGMLISMNAAVNVFGISFAANGFAAIYTSGGIAMQITLSVRNSTNPTVTIIPNILALSGSFVLQINTTSNSSFTVNGTTYNIAAGTVFNISVNASLNVFGFSLAKASINIVLTTSGFAASGTSSFNFFGFVTFGVDFYFSANFNNGNVQYWFYGGAYVRLGSSGFNIHGSLTFEVSNVNTTDNIPGGYYHGRTITSGITIRIDGGVTAFGFNFASIGASISINGTHVYFSVYVSVSFYFFSVGGTVTIDLGSIIPVPTPPPPPSGTKLSSSTTIDGQTFGAGTLLINIGQYANSNRGVAPFSIENITIKILSGGTVTVTNPNINGGNPETYTGVTEIVVPNADIGNGTSNINLTVLTETGGSSLPVVIFAGSGNNTFNLSGTGGTITINGTDGNDTVDAGSGHMIFNAGSGANTFNGGTGTATINGSNGRDTIIGGTGNLTFNVGSGNSTFTGGGTGSTHNTINDPGPVTVTESGYNSYSLDGTSSTAGTLTYGGNTDTINNASGDVTVVLIGVASGTQTFSVSDYYGLVTLDAAGNSASNVTTTITSSSGNLSLTGNTVTESGGPNGTITLQSTSGANSSAYGSLNLDGGSGANTFTVNSWSGTGTVTLDGKGGSDTYIINFQSSGSFTVNVNDTGAGASDTDTMIANGTVTGDTLYVTGAAVSLGSQTANYSGIENLTVNTAANNETVDVSSTSTATTINTASYTDTINVGSNAATTNTGGTLNNINSALTVSGTSRYDTLNLDDSGDTGANAGTLTASTLSGVLGVNGSLSYSNIKNLNLKLGSGADTLDVTGTSSTTNINASLGTNTLNIGSNAATTNTGGVLSNIKAALIIVGSGTTAVNVDDTGDTAAIGVLTSTMLKGLGMASSGITYSGLSALTISLGNDGNTFTFNNTNSSTTTTLNSGTGADTVNLLMDSGTTIINGQGGADTINVFNDGGTTTLNESSGNNIINIQATSARTNVNTTSGSNIINIGSNAPALNGVLTGIQGAIYIAGSGSDTVNAGDTGSQVTETGLLTSTTLTGLGMTADGITYSGLAVLNISLGSGNDTMNVQSTYSATVTTINTGAGVNTVNVTSNAPGTSGGVVSGIAGELIVNGQGADTLNVNDTGDPAGGTLTQTTTTLTGLGMGANGIVYSSIETLNLSLGSGNDTVYIRGNPAITTENLNTGGGANIISIGSQAQSSIITDTNSANAYTTLGNATNTGSVLDDVLGTINITGSGNDTLNIDDSGSTTAAQGGMWANKIEFLASTTNYTTVAVTINFTGVAGIYISFSQANDQFLVSDTFTSSSTTPVVVIDGNGGNDTFLVFDSHAVMTINGGSGDDTFYNFGNSAVLNLNGDAGDDTFYVYASVSAGATNVGAGTALDSGSNKVYSYRVNSPVNIDGGTGNDKLFIFGTVLNDTFTITATSVTGAGLEVNYTNIEHVTVAGLGGNDTFYIESISVPTLIIGDGTIVLPSVANFLQALNAALPDLNGGAPPATSFNDTFYVGWQGASYIPGSLAGIVAPLTIYGDNGPNAAGATINQPGTNDTIYVDDSADTFNRSFTLTSSTLTGTGFGTGGELVYDSAVENLNFQLGNGNNTMTVNSTGTGVQTSIYGGRGNDAFIVNDADGGALLTPLALFGGLNTFPGDTLTLNGAPAGNTYNITGYTIEGAGATISYEEIETLTINASGATTFNVNGDSIPTYLNGGAGNDTFNVNSNTVSLYLTSGAGDNTYVINANAGMLTATGDAGNNAGSDNFTINGNSGTLTLSGGAGNDSFVINSNSGALTANGNAGNDTFTVNALSSSATLNGGTGNDTFTVNTPLAAVLTVNGGGDSGDWLTINGSTGNDSVTITGSSVSGLGAAIAYRATNLVVNGVSGNDTFLIAGTSTFITRVNGGIYGNDTFNVQATTGSLYLTGGAVGDNTFNLGSLAPVFGGTLANLVGPIFISGGTNIMRLITLAGTGNNTVNVDDSGDAAGNSGTLTSSTLTGLGMGGGVTFVSVNSMNIYLGPGNDTFNVQSTNSTTVTMLNTGSGTNTVNAGSLAPAAGGVLSDIQGALIVVGSGEDTLNVDNSGSATDGTGTLTPTVLNGLGMDASGIVYSGLANLNISLSQGNDTLLVANTPSAVTRINSNGGNDTFNVQATTGSLYLDGGSGSNTFNLGSLAPVMTGGTLSGLAGGVFINGGTNVMRLIGLNSTGTNTLNLDDTGVTANATATLGASTLAGLGMGAGVAFVSVNVLNLNLGAGNDTLVVTGASGATVTNVDGGPGVNNATFNFTGDFASPDFTLLNFAGAAMSIGGNFTGVFNDAGAITTVAIAGSLASSGVLNAGSISTMTIGGDLAGQLNVTGLLGSLTVDGGTSGTIGVGDVHVITVRNGSGNTLLNVTEDGIQREILATPVAGGAMPDTTHFAFVYDSETGANPQAAIRITDANPVARSYNLALKVVNSSTAKFNLSLLDSYLNGETGLSNISVWGDLMTRLTAPELQLAPDLTASSRAGVVLPSDSITGVEVSGNLPQGFIDVAGIEGLAFGTFTTASGMPITVSSVFGSTSNIQVIWNLLGSEATLNLATDAFVNPFNARLYEHINANPDMVLVN